MTAAAVLFYPLWRGIRQVKIIFHREEYGQPLAILGGLLAWTLHSLTDVNLQVPASTGMAIIMALLLLHDQPQEKEPQKIANPPETRHLTAIRLTGLGLAVLTLTGAAVMLHGEYAFANLCTVCEPVVETGKPPRPNPPEEVREVFQQANAAMPWSPFPYATVSRYMTMIGDLPAAEQLIRQAIQRSPERAAFYYRLAVLQHQQGREAEAEQTRQKAQELYPHFPDYRRWPETTISSPERE